MKFLSTSMEIQLMFYSVNKHRILRVQSNHYLFPLFFPAALDKYGEFERIFPFRN